jgi:hypothetical protein
MEPVASNVWEAVGQLFIAGGVMTTALFGYLAVRDTRRGNRAIETNHGKQPREYLELIGEVHDTLKTLQTQQMTAALQRKSIEASVDTLVEVFKEHTQSDAENFAVVEAALEELKAS